MSNRDAWDALARKFFDRRNVQLFETVRSERNAIAERRAAAGTLNDGGFVSDVTSAYVAGFEAFARGLTADVFDLVRRSGTALDDATVLWIRGQLEPRFEVAANHMRSEAGQGRVLPDELRQSVDQAMTKAVARMTRDLGIELDLATLPSAAPAVVSDPALRDPLVPLQNRRGLEVAFERRAKDEPLCLVFFDIDHFKAVNDKQGGHATGDEALVSIADTAVACVRAKGQAFRFGGDEFALLLPNHTLQEGIAVAERFRREVHSSPRTSQQLTLSVSVGVAQYPSHGEDLAALLKAADGALYDAKNRNRNVVRYFGEPEPTAHGPREPERKQPDVGQLSAEERLKIRQDYFRSRVARCPRDEAVLDVHDVTAQQDTTARLIVLCPLCGLSENL